MRPIESVRRWLRYRRLLSALTDEYLGAGWRIGPEAYERIRQQARAAAGYQPGAGPEDGQETAAREAA